MAPPAGKAKRKAGEAKKKLYFLVHVCITKGGFTVFCVSKCLLSFGNKRLARSTRAQSVSGCNNGCSQDTLLRGTVHLSSFLPGSLLSNWLAASTSSSNRTVNACMHAWSQRKVTWGEEGCCSPVESAVS